LPREIEMYSGTFLMWKVTTRKYAAYNKDILNIKYKINRNKTTWHHTFTWQTRTRTRTTQRMCVLEIPKI
jgi:hypothetical protein